MFRVSDVINLERGYIQEKYKDRYKIFNLEARNMFTMKIWSILIIKCVLYGVIGTMINFQLIRSKYPWCSIVQTWNYIIKCSKTKLMQK